MEQRPVELMSFMELRERDIAKKKKKKGNVSRSSEAGGQIGTENVQGQDHGHYQEVLVERFSLFPCPNSKDIVIIVKQP